jgi:hypothetical protein
MVMAELRWQWARTTVETPLRDERRSTATAPGQLAAAVPWRIWDPKQKVGVTLVTVNGPRSDGGAAWRAPCSPGTARTADIAAFRATRAVPPKHAEKHCTHLGLVTAATLAEAAPYIRWAQAFFDRLCRTP